MLPVICILCRLLSVPYTNCGDPQTAVPELVHSSLGVRAANQRLRWEENVRFKLHPPQSTGGAHESVTSRRFSQSRGSLQIDSDSTPLTSETSTRASPIKSLLWFPALIINASELSRAVIGTWLSSTCTHLCEGAHLLDVAVPSATFFTYVCISTKKAHVSASFSLRCPVSCGVRLLFVLVVTSPSQVKAIKRLTGNWCWHIEFLQETWRGAPLFTAEVDAGKPEMAFREKKKCCCKHRLSLLTSTLTLIRLHLDCRGSLLKAQKLHRCHDYRLQVL